MSEVALIYADDDCILLEELRHQATDPDPLLIVGPFSVLGVCLVELLVSEMELVLHHLPDSSH